MKTRIITSVVGLCFLALVLSMFNTIVLDLVVAALCLLGVHEAFAAFGFKTSQLYLYVPFVPFTILVMLSHGSAARAVLLPAAFVFMLSLCYAWGGDSAAYFTGRFLGRHKLAPEVSPHKTIEGAIGGVCGSVLLGVLATWIYSTLANRLEMFTAGRGSGKLYLLIALMGAVASVLGILGDLFASAVKRQCGIKDYGSIFPGHGGILDRFDSVMFIAPFVTIVVRWVFYAYQA